MTVRSRQPGQFTGTHMAFIMVAFFAVIIAVNLLMANFATRSWTGLVVKNSYVASQGFNDVVAAKRRQDAMGWRGEYAMSGGSVSYRISGRSGDPAAVNSIELTFRRPTFEADDHTVALSLRSPGEFGAEHRLADGTWVINVSADAGTDVPWHDSFRVIVKDGGIVK